MYKSQAAQAQEKKSQPDISPTFCTYYKAQDGQFTGVQLGSSWNLWSKVPNLWAQSLLKKKKATWRCRGACHLTRPHYVKT